MGRRLGIPFVSKKYQKLVAGRCRICNEPCYDVLDVHRIHEGSEGGRYTYDNIVILCAKHHRLQQTGAIKVIGWKHSTMGRILHWIDEEGTEHFS